MALIGACIESPLSEFIVTIELSSLYAGLEDEVSHGDRRCFGSYWATREETPLLLTSLPALTWQGNSLNA
jgi:hypothetical protein